MNLFRRSQPDAPTPNSLAAVASEAATKTATRSARPRLSFRSLVPSKVADRLFGDLNVIPVHINELLKRGLRADRAQARARTLESPVAAKFLQLCENNIAGHRGIILQSRAADKAHQTAVEDAFRLWGQRGNCDVTGTLSWLDIQRVAIATAARDGEVFIRKHCGPKFGPFGFQLELIDAERIDTEATRELRGGTYISLGIEYTALGKPVAYHVVDRVDGFAPFIPSTSRATVAIPASEIIHVFKPSHISQGRGISWLSPVLDRLKMLDGYHMAALVNARNGAANMGFIYSDGEDIDFGKKPEGDVVTEVEPGLITTLPTGMKFQAYDPNYPAAEFPEFVRACLREIAAGLGVTYSNLSGDLSQVNFSSLRTGADNERDHWKMTQAWFVGAFCAPIFSAWLDMALLSGRVRNGSRPLGEASRAALSDVSWICRSWPYVNPLQEANAHMVLVRNGLKTPSDVIRSFGQDPDEVFAELKTDRAKLAAAGVTPAEAK